MDRKHDAGTGSLGLARSTPQSVATHTAYGETNDHWLAGEVVDAANALTRNGTKRSILGIAGVPAAGKSTLAAALVRYLGSRAVNVPMDGFHLADRQIARLGLADRKGAPATFDAHGYRVLLTRIREAPGRDEMIYAPVFERTLDQPIAAGIAVAPETSLVITEGNYLLLNEPPWPEVAHYFDEIWYLDVPDDIRDDRLIERHIHDCGRTETEARNWIAGNDHLNADHVTRASRQADRYLAWDGAMLRFR